MTVVIKESKCLGCGYEIYFNEEHGNVECDNCKTMNYYSKHLENKINNMHTEVSATPEITDSQLEDMVLAFVMKSCPSNMTISEACKIAYDLKSVYENLIQDWKANES
jgi:hypothetical protein